MKYIIRALFFLAAGFALIGALRLGGRWQEAVILLGAAAVFAGVGLGLTVLMKKRGG